MRPTERVWLAVLSRHDSDRLPVPRRNKGKTDRKRETRGNRSSSQLGVKKMSIKHITYTERFQTDKSSYVFHPIAIPATSFKI